MPPRKRRHWIPGWDYFEYLLARALAGLLNRLPIEISTRIAAFFGDIFYYVLPKRRQLALENLNLAYGNSLSGAQKEKIARESFCHVAISLMEFFRMPAMVKEARARFEFEGLEHIDAVFAKGKGVVGVISHLGSWEYLGFLPYLHDYPCSVIVRDIRNPYLNRWIEYLRIQTRLNPIPKKNSIREVLSELRQNHLVAILIDQWAGNEGIWTKFFGKPTSTTAIPVRLAHRTGAGLLPFYCLRTRPGHYKIFFRPEVPIEEGEDYEAKTTEKLNRLLEKEILAAPEQWSWGHRRWKEK